MTTQSGERPAGITGLLPRGDGERDAPTGPATSPPLRRILVAVDTVALLLGWLAVELVVARAAGDGSWITLDGVALLVTGTGSGLFLLSASGLYQRRICQVRSVELARIARVAAILGLVAVLRAISTDLGTALVAGLAGSLTWLAVIGAERGLFREWIAGRRASGDYRAPVLVVGAGPEAMGTASFLQEHPVFGFDVRGVAGPDGVTDGSVPWLGDIAATPAAARHVGATGVVIDGGSLTGTQLNGAVHTLSAANLHVHVTSGLRGVDRRRITVSPMADETFLHIAPVDLSRRQVRAKRLLDLVAGAGLLVLGAPLLALIALAVWAGDRGPVFFRQTRVGQHGEPFTLVKFRTMVPDAEARLQELLEENARKGPLFKMGRDPRVTRVGRFLRASSLDELPQLWHVVTGSMSMVGPRPALPEEVAQFDDELAARTRVKPGLTGLWQVEARDQPSFDLYRRYDLLYVENWSLALDLAIIARTITATVSRALRSFGAPRAPAHEQGVGGPLD